MDTSKLTPGDRVEVNVRGQVFAARYVSSPIVDRGRHRIEPEPSSISYFLVTSRQIVKKLGVAG